jgi:EAL domain-containing protein (putative c-di-GMP-specific phosphodiesterase class I)/FixJ family two-component response regulator
MASPDKSTNLSALVVDDDPWICAFIKKLVEHDGFTVETLTESERFLDAYDDNLGLIFLDLNMPNVDGIEVLRIIADKESKAAIVLISVYEENILRAARDIATDRGLGVLGTLKKPFEADDIVGILDRFRETGGDARGSRDLKQAFSPEGTAELPSLDDLRGVIESKGLEVFFQPKIFMPERKFVGVESLARWNHPEKGFIPPDYFIPFAEQYGLIDRLTDLVLDETCRRCKEWFKLGKTFEVSVNVSEQNLGDLKFPEKLSEKIKEYELPHSAFCFEVTESSLSSDPAHVLDVLTRLRLKGFQLSIDDFGTGHSSLARLRRMPFGELKIDKMFVDGAESDQECRVIIRNTVALARGLELKVVAEGVENEAQLDFLWNAGCNVMQGYLFSKPMPGEQFENWLQNWNL